MPPDSIAAAAQLGSKAGLQSRYGCAAHAVKVLNRNSLQTTLMTSERCLRGSLSKCPEDAITLLQGIAAEHVA